jgi:hypothetical protein
MATETGKRKKRLGRKPANYFKRWTPAEDLSLRDMVEAGKNTRQIARELGRSGPSIWGRKQFLGIESRITNSPRGMSPYNGKGEGHREETETPTSTGASQAVIELTQTVGALAKKFGVNATVVVFEGKK